MLQKNRHLQQYVEWSDVINAIVNEYLINEMDKKAYIAVHMRRASDWVNTIHLCIMYYNFYQDITLNWFIMML